MIDILLESAVRTLCVAGFAALALKFMRVRNPHTEMAVWKMVLGVAMAMPLLLILAPGAVLVSMPSAAMEDVATMFPGATVAAAVPALRWGAPVFAVYVAGFCVMLFRIALGLVLSRRLLKGARPVLEHWTDGYDVRTSTRVSVPVTLGAVIVLPEQYRLWDEATRRSVMAHEVAHIARGDFYLLLIAALHRAIFWFSPLGWWLMARLGYLAEVACDLAAAAEIGDRSRYAEILLTMSGKAGRFSPGLAMAQARGVAARIDSLLAATAPPRRMTGRRWFAVSLCLLPLTGLAACVDAKPQDRLIPAARPFERVEMRPVVEKADGIALRMAGSDEVVYVSRDAFLRSLDFRKVIARQDDGRSVLDVTVRPEAAVKLQRGSADNVGRRTAFIVDGEVVMAPVMRVPLTSTSFVIDGDAGKNALRILSGLGRER